MIGNFYAVIAVANLEDKVTITMLDDAIAIVIDLTFLKLISYKRPYILF